MPGINQAELKAAAEHLEWVLGQYPGSEQVRRLHRALAALIEEAKAGKVLERADKIPCSYNFADGVYRSYKTPNVDAAYARFATEMEGGLTEQEKRLIEDTEAMRREMGLGPSHE